MYTVTFYKYFTAGTLKGLTVPASFPVSELPRAQWHVDRLDDKRRHAVEQFDLLTGARWIVADTPAPHYR